MSALLSDPSLPHAFVSCLIRLRRVAIDGKSKNFIGELGATLYVSQFYLALQHFSESTNWYNLFTRMLQMICLYETDNRIITRWWHTLIE